MKNKQDIKKRIQRKVDDHILEPTNADLILKFINQEDTSYEEAYCLYQLISSNQRAGLHYNPRFEKVKSETISYLKKDEEHSFVQDNKPINKLILGDNYDALKNLLITYKEMIDVIYIDPPYGSDSMGQFADTNYKNNLTRDNLLSMLQPRLELALELLADDGVIFCSIDDKNQAYVKCLMDEIFGEENFVNNIIWYYKNSTMKSSANKLSKTHENVLVYKKKSFIPLQIRYGDVSEKFIERFGKYAKDGKIYYKDVKNEESYLERVIPKFIKDNGRKPEDNDILQELQPNYLRDLIEMPTIRNNDFKRKFGLEFSHSKNPNLISLLLKLHPRKNAMVLDFFAGSGTTGQAVLELNKEDGGNRRFILTTLKEDNGHNIGVDVCAERLKRIMTGSGYNGETDFGWNKQNEPLGGNLEVTEIASIANNSQNIFDEIDETLYGLKKFENIQDKIKWVCNNFENTQYRLEEIPEED